MKICYKGYVTLLLKTDLEFIFTLKVYLLCVLTANECGRYEHLLSLTDKQCRELKNLAIKCLVSRTGLFCFIWTRFKNPRLVTSVIVLPTIELIKGNKSWWGRLRLNESNLRKISCFLTLVSLGLQLIFITWPIRTKEPVLNHFSG